MVELSDLIARRCEPLTDWEERLLFELRLMPERLRERDLGWWDSRFEHVWANGPTGELDEPRLAADLLWRVWQFGGCNLYGAFDAERTRLRYEALIGELNEALGLELVADGDVSTW